MQKKIELDYFTDLSHIFELKGNVDRAIKDKIQMGTEGSLYPDLGILLGELTRLQSKVGEQK